MKSYLGSILLVASMIALLVGERLLGPGNAARPFVSGLAVALGVAAVAFRALRKQKAPADTRPIEGVLLWLAALGLAALFFYFLQSDVPSKLIDKDLAQAAPKLVVMLEVLWPALVLAALLPTLLAEMAYSSMSRAPKMEEGRVRDAVFSGLGIAAVLVFAFAGYYAATKHDVKWDLSYFRTARPGEATRKIAQAFTQEIKVTLFFPPANEVKDQVVDYFKELQKETKFLVLEELDRDLEPTKARELNIFANGQLVIAKGAQRETLSMNLDLETARAQLRDFDNEVQKHLISVARSRKTVYLTTGHGERSNQPMGQNDKRSTITALEDLLRAQNQDVRPLGAGEGLASDVPSDAAAVLVIGPERAFLPEEVAALQRYIDRGGRMLIALDPEAGQEFKELLAPLGVRFIPNMLANDQVYVRRTQQITDRINIVTAAFSSHPSVTSLGQLGQRAPLIFVGAGYLEAIKDAKGGAMIDGTVRSHEATFDDINNNYEFNAPAEKRAGRDLVMAVTKKAAQSGVPETRAVIIADSDGISDMVFGVAGNGYLALDAVKWLVGDESIAGVVSTEKDVPIEHTKKQDQLWFYSTILVAPALVVLVGYLVTRRRGRASRREVVSRPTAEVAR